MTQAQILSPLPRQNPILIEQDIRSIHRELKFRSRNGVPTDHLERSIRNLRRRRWQLQGEDELVVAKKIWRGI